MHRSVRLLAGVLILAGPAAIACGPDFPWQLLSDRAGTLEAAPANSFAFEVARFIAPGDMLTAVEGSEPSASDSFADPEVDTIYRQAILAFRNGDHDDAAAGLEKVLAFPKERTSDNLLRATFNAARAAAKRDRSTETAAYFQQVRRLALAGAVDPLGLAVGSYGEEARLHYTEARAQLVGEDLPAGMPTEIYAREMAATITLYAEQAARGSASAVASLRFVVEHLFESQDRVSAVIRQPMTQQLLVAYAIRRTDLETDSQWIRTDEARKPSSEPTPPLSMLTTAMKQVDLPRIEGVDKLAVLAYRLGDFTQAEHLAAGSPSSLASWVRAKLALQNGKLEASAAFFSEAAKAFQRSTDLEPANLRRLQGEAAVLQLLRQEYVEALRTLWPYADRYWGDITTIAERVLTVSELRGFVDGQVPPKPTSEPTSKADWDSSQKLRLLLARRLMREQAFEAALTYFDRGTVHDEAQRFATAVRQGRSASNPMAKAASLWDAAQIARHSGMEIMGFEGAPDYASVEGAYRFGYGQEDLGLNYVSRGELHRFEASLKSGNFDRRFHYRYTAVSLAQEAADHTPPRSQAYAALLCRATGWMLETENGIELARDLYRTYVKKGAYVDWAADFGRNCEEPEFDRSFPPRTWLSIATSAMPQRLVRWLKRHLT